jgi:hypothetical protein
MVEQKKDCRAIDGRIDFYAIFVLYTNNNFMRILLVVLYCFILAAALLCSVGVVATRDQLYTNEST